MRWQYCAQPPDRNLLVRLRPGAGDQAAAARRSGTRPSSSSTTARSSHSNRSTPTSSGAGPSGDLQPLDRWLVERTAQLVTEAEAGYERWLTVDVTRAFEGYVDDLSNWYIRRSRRRFWDGDEAALRTLWFALVQGLRVISPVMPFLAEHLWQALVTDVVEEAPDSVFLAGWPEVRAPRIWRCSRRSRSSAASSRSVTRRVRRLGSSCGSRCRRIVVEGAPLAAAHADEIAEELRVKEVEFGHVDAELRVKPHLPVLGPKLGKELGVVRAALQAGDFEELEGGGFRVAGHDLGSRRGAGRARGQGGMGGCRRCRRDGRDRYGRRRRAGARGQASTSSSTASTRCGRTRASRSPTASPSRSRRPTATVSRTPSGSPARRSRCRSRPGRSTAQRSRRRDGTRPLRSRGRRRPRRDIPLADAERVGSCAGDRTSRRGSTPVERRSARRSALGLGEDQLATQLDRELERHVLDDELERLDPVDAHAPGTSRTDG